MIENWIAILLSSAVVSVIVSGITTYVLEKRKYNQEYWKITIEKRLEVYERIERILSYFQSPHIIDERPCHLAFLDVKSFDSINAELAAISWKRNWISANLYQQISELTQLFSQLNPNENLNDKKVAEFGIENYSVIANKRDRMLEIMNTDYLEMPEVANFFKSKLPKGQSTGH